MAFYDVDNAMTVKLDYELPKVPAFREGIRRAPRREAHLSQADKALAIRNALRYIHPDHPEEKKYKYKKACYKRKYYRSLKCI